MNEQQREALEAVESLYDRVDSLDGMYCWDKEHETARTYILNSTPMREGWQLVPVEPTEDMKKACDNTPGPMTAWKAWQVMLAAAPTPEEL